MRFLLLIALSFSITAVDVDAKTRRTSAARYAFKKLHPCPATGKTSGACTGWIIDHIKPLACDGADAPFNMQWQTKEAAKAKDKWELKECRR